MILTAFVSGVFGSSDLGHQIFSKFLSILVFQVLTTTFSCLMVPKSASNKKVQSRLRGESPK